MRAGLRTAGESLSIECEPGWVARMVKEASAGELVDEPARPTLRIVVERARVPFGGDHWNIVTRGAWRCEGAVMIENACASGFDLLFEQSDPPVFRFRWRPPLDALAASRVLPTRFVLLARAVLLEFPPMWRASLRGRAPLHAVACTAGGQVPLLAGPGGVGKSTLLLRELAAGGSATSDNLCVSDGRTVWGVVAPARLEGGPGRSMPHGRREAPMPGRVETLEPDRLIVLGRNGDRVARIASCPPAVAVRQLVTGTYMAGELRRYWPFAATLSAGSGLGPAHPPVQQVARSLASRLPSLELALPENTATRLSDVLSPVAVLQ